MDDIEATVPDGPSVRRRNAEVLPGKLDFVTSRSQLEWAICYETEMPYLIRYLISCFDSADMSDAADAAHYAFTELFVKWDTVRNPKAWLRKVAFRQMLRQPVKGENPPDTPHAEPAVLSASAQLELREEEQMVLAALSQLPLTQRRVFALVYDRFSYREIAEIMNMSEVAVRQNAGRARRKMKELLGLNTEQA